MISSNFDTHIPMYISKLAQKIHFRDHSYIMLSFFDPLLNLVMLAGFPYIHIISALKVNLDLEVGGLKRA